jgi:hypothetical protein
MLAVPAATPVTSPVEASTVATPVASLLHVPPATASLSVLVAPTQKVVVPIIANGVAGDGLTVIIWFTVLVPQLLVNEYCIVVPPAATPVTSPVVLTVAVAGVTLDQVPPLVASVNVVVAPTHTVAAPLIAAIVGTSSIVTLAVTSVVPQVLVTE